MGARVRLLKNRGRSITLGTKNFSAELAVLRRVQEFRFDDYPDETAPWHLISWPTMRWLHVFYVIAIIEKLHQAKGAAMGEYLRLMPFQILIILCFLGPEDPDTKLRIIREGLLTIGRKNAKTTLIAAIVTALMVLDKANYGMAGGEVYVGASDRKQAGITFDIVNKFILQDRELGISDQFRSVPSQKRMTHKGTLTEFEVLSSDAYRAHGLNASIVILDEIANVPAGAAAEFYSVLTSGYGAQLEPLTLLLSTQAPSDTHIFSTQVDSCKRVNRGDEEPTNAAGFVFETPEVLGVDKLDPHDERWWYLANPGLGVSPSLADMQAESRKAKVLPAMESAFRNLRLNQRANTNNPLINKSTWVACGDPVDYERLYGRKCWGALDLSSVRDLTALVLVFEENDDGKMPVVPYFWLPGKGLAEKEQNDKVPYVLWSKQGFLNAESDVTIDYDLIASQIEVCMSDYSVQGIAFDRWRIEDLRARLRDRGLGSYADDEHFMIPIGQGFKDMTLCVESLEKTVLEGRLAHGGHPVLTWNMANAVALTDAAGNRKPDKAKSFGRIDGAVALMMALRARELLCQVIADGPSAFETEECLM